MTNTLDALKAGQLQGVKRLDLSAGLTEFPAEIFDLADSLEVLNLANNQLTSLPDEFGRLQHLKIAFFSHNNFQAVPTILSHCPNLSMVSFKSNQLTTLPDASLPPSLRWLILTDNQLEQLPTSMGQLHYLQKLMLAGNQLRSLPPEMVACQNLELIRLSANQLTTLPTWLFTLPRLSWLAYAGNPFCDATPSPSTPLPEINWSDLTIQNTLGEGASGVISRAIWTPALGQAVDVAIKVFKGSVTSDGLPVDEMRACIAAGTHPHLVQLLGRLTHHPEQKAGLVFAFIPPTYKTLGQPPSLETCTRDTYPPDTQFTWAVLLQIARGIATAATHLQSQGILHGDLYAHNILVNSAGESLLGDYGAASFYPADQAAIAPSLERLEVRAFGCLLEDLLDHAVLEDDPRQVQGGDRLRHLQQACMDPVPSQRPRFSQICELLAELI